MKTKDLVFYTLSILSLFLFIFLPVINESLNAQGTSAGEVSMVLLESVDHYVTRRY